MATNVLIVGAGVAGLETALALRELAGDRVAVTVLAPERQFVDRPLAVREPFGGPTAGRHVVATLVADMGAELVADKLAWVDPAGRVAHTEGGGELSYDALVLTLGGHRYARFPHATTIDDRRLDDQLHGLIEDIEGGHVRSVAFVIPERVAWPLPIYELALMTAQRAADMDVAIDVTVVTPEAFPLGVFGADASREVSALIAEAGIALETEAFASVHRPGHVSIRGSALGVDAERIVALPELVGPAVRGLPVGAHGFLTVDACCRVREADDVYAAGDAADFPVKHGGLAAQQADTIATMIASRAGAPVVPKPFRSDIHGLLFTGGAPRFLSARLSGGGGIGSAAATESPSSKTAARYLTPYLARRDARSAGQPTRVA